MDNEVRDKCIQQILANQRVMLDQIKTTTAETAIRVTAALLDEVAVSNDRGIK